MNKILTQLSRRESVKSAIRTNWEAYHYCLAQSQSVELSIGRYLTWLITDLPDHFMNLVVCNQLPPDGIDDLIESTLGHFRSLNIRRLSWLTQLGVLDASVRMDSLLFALLAEAVADIRRIREAHQGEVKPEIQRRKFEAWERGQIVSSAGFLLDFSQDWNLPDSAVKLSYSVLQAEEPYLDEIVAASVAGIPWRHEFPNACMRCGKPGSWRPILNPSLDAPVEIAWRYQRPENAIPICHHCTETLDLLRNCVKITSVFRA